MTGSPEELKARAQRAFEQSIGRTPGEMHEAPDPDELARLERAVLSLPRTTREVFLAHRLDDQSYAKIADVTGLSVKQVRRHMTEALHRLGRFMDGDERTAGQRWWQSYLQRWFR